MNNREVIHDLTENFLQLQATQFIRHLNKEGFSVEPRNGEDNLEFVRELILHISTFMGPLDSDINQFDPETRELFLGFESLISCLVSEICEMRSN